MTRHAAGDGIVSGCVFFLAGGGDLLLALRNQIGYHDDMKRVSNAFSAQ